jgi:hypothetical protein
MKSLFWLVFFNGYMPSNWFILNVFFWSDYSILEKQNIQYYQRNTFSKLPSWLLKL